MKLWVNFVVISLLTGGVVCAGRLEVRSAWGQALEVDMLTICHGGQDTAVPETEEDTHGAFTGGGPDGTEPDSYTFDMMKLMVTLPDPACASLEEPVSLEVTGHAALVKQTDEGEHEELGQTYTGSFDDLLPYILVKATAPSEQAKDIEIKATFGSCEDTVNATAVSIAWIDDDPDYARDPAEYQKGKYTDNGDSDNFFLRHLVRPRKDDGTPDYSHSGDPDYQDIDLWYRIMPEDLRELDKVVEHVQINIYREDTSETVNTIEVDQEDSLEKLDGKQVYHVVWDGTEIRNPATGEFTVAGFYRVELEVQLDGMPDPLTTSIEDGDEYLPGWQCPQDGLAIHDLAYKHRPDVYMGSGEVVAPNGPVYPFSPGIIGNYSLCKDLLIGCGPAWTGSENYFEFGAFPLLTAENKQISEEKPVPESSYKVLLASMNMENENEEEVGKHYIDIRDPSFKVTEEALNELEGKIDDEDWLMLGVLEGETFPDKEMFMKTLRETMMLDISLVEEEYILKSTGNYLNQDCEHGMPYLLHWGHADKHPNYVFIQYWMYTTVSHAPYNTGGFVNNAFNHEGEWEMVQIALRLRNLGFPAKKSEWLLPYAAIAAQHGYGQTLAWRIDKNGPMILDQRYVATEEEGNRVKIYVAENAHATYFRPGEIEVVALPPSQQRAGIQVQYEDVSVVSGYYDKISGPERKDYSLLALNDFEGAGMYGWPGHWGLDALPFVPIPRGPKFSEPVEDLAGNGIEKATDPVSFHNSCRKLVDGNGNFDPIHGTKDPKTELQ